MRPDELLPLSFALRIEIAARLIASLLLMQVDEVKKKSSVITLDSNIQ